MCLIISLINNRVDKAVVIRLYSKNGAAQQNLLDNPFFYRFPLARLCDLQSIWQLWISVAPPLLQAVTWSASILFAGCMNSLCHDRLPTRDPSPLLRMTNREKAHHITTQHGIAPHIKDSHILGFPDFHILTSSHPLILSSSHSHILTDTQHSRIPKNPQPPIV